MREKEKFSYAGKIIKTQGYKGGLIAHIEPGFKEKIIKTEFVFVEIQHERVPFFIVSIEHQYNNVFFILLEDIDILEKAQKLSGCGLFLMETAKAEKSSQKAFHNYDLKDLTGFDVVDNKSGNIGKIDQILELPQQHIMQVFHDKKEILIPFNEDIVLSIDVVHKRVNIQAPEGLIDFYME
ncbi:MAG TPA: ribosome maturation factor RimM [Bacteroidales bacterium]|nr:ribosome maturation factor RimM [Bacteroidales bacterium]